MPNNMQAIYAEGARDLARQLIGRDFTDEELAAAVGALDGATLKVTRKRGADELRIDIEHPWIREQHRWMRRDEKGALLIFNYRFYKQPGAPAGIGLDSFQRQVAGAQALGVKRIETFAAGNHRSLQSRDEVGYLVWAKFGFNLRLNPTQRFVLQRTPELMGVQTLNELILLPGGEEWWKLNGEAGKMIFELDADSPMMNVFRHHLKKKGRQLL